MRRFKLHFSFNGEEVDTAVIELADEVINVVDDEWRSFFYNLRTPEEIAAHIGHCYFDLQIPLGRMDGWADQPDSNIRVIQRPYLIVDFDVQAEEVE